MNNRQSRLLRMFERAHLGLTKRPVDPEPPLLAEKREELERVLERIARLSARQHLARTGIRSYAADTEARKQRLRRERMMPLVRLAKPLRKFAPGAERALVVPHTRVNGAMVAAAADRLVKLLKPHAKLLVSAGYSKTHLAEVAKEARELARACGASDRQRKELSRVTGELKAAFEAGKRSVAVAEAIIMAHAPPETLADWKELSRVGARIGRPLERTRRKRTASEKAAAVAPPA